MRHPTISIRLTSLVSEHWLNNKGRWATFNERKRFSDKDETAQEDAEAFVREQFGSEFKKFGLFTNS